MHKRSRLGPVSHLPNLLADKITPLLRQGFLKTYKSEITGEKIAAPKWIWVQGSGIQTPSKCKS